MFSLPDLAMNDQSNSGTFSLPYNPEALPRELARHYIPASEKDIAAMLETAGASGMKDLFRHIDAEFFMPEALPVPEEQDGRCPFSG